MTESTQTLSNEDWSQNVCGSLFSMMNFGEMCDIYLQGLESDQLIPVHSCVMSAVSPLIRRFLAGEDLDTADNKQIIVQLEGLAASAIERVVKFVYTGSLHYANTEDVFGVLEAAEMMEIEPLVQLCMKATKEFTNADEGKLDLEGEDMKEDIVNLPHDVVLEPVASEVELGSTEVVYQDEDIPYVEQTISTKDESAMDPLGAEQDPTIAELEAQIMKELRGIVVKKEADDTYVVELTENDVHRIKSHETVAAMEDVQTEGSHRGLKPRTVRDYQKISYHGCGGLVSKSDRRHECVRCGKSFAKRCELELHHTSHRDDYDFNCPICGKAFKYKNSIRLHMKRHGDRTYECELCKKKFFTPNDLSQHMAIHAGIRQHECAMCQKSFRKRSDYRWHMLRQHQMRLPGVDYSAYRCPRCDQGFQLRCELNSHLKYGHAKEYRCRHCSAVFRLAREQKIHMEQEHADLLQKSYNCRICHKGFEKAWKADLHQRMVHHTGEKYYCSYEGCDYVAYRKYDLKDHERRHLTSKRLARKVLKNKEAESEDDEGVKEDMFPETSDYLESSEAVLALQDSSTEGFVKPESSDSTPKALVTVKVSPKRRPNVKEVFCDRCGFSFTYGGYMKHIHQCKLDE